VGGNICSVHEGPGGNGAASAAVWGQDAAAHVREAVAWAQEGAGGLSYEEDEARAAAATATNEYELSTSPTTRGQHRLSSETTLFLGLPLCTVYACIDAIMTELA
jgi:hypothetical protein